MIHRLAIYNMLCSGWVKPRGCLQAQLCEEREHFRAVTERFVLKSEQFQSTFENSRLQQKLNSIQAEDLRKQDALLSLQAQLATTTEQQARDKQHLEKIQLLMISTCAEITGVPLCSFLANNQMN